MEAKSSCSVYEHPTPSPARQVEVPFSLHPATSKWRTTVWDVGSLDADSCLAQAFPIPAGYRASCPGVLGHHEALMETHATSGGTGIACQVKFEDTRQVFQGTTPTAAFVSAALAHASANYINGLQAFGLVSPVVKLKLQQQAQQREAQRAQHSPSAAAEGLRPASSAQQQQQRRQERPPEATAPNPQPAASPAASHCSQGQCDSPSRQQQQQQQQPPQQLVRLVVSDAAAQPSSVICTGSTLPAQQPAQRSPTLQPQLQPTVVLHAAGPSIRLHQAQHDSSPTAAQSAAAGAAASSSSVRLSGQEAALRPRPQKQQQPTQPNLHLPTLAEQAWWHAASMASTAATAASAAAASNAAAPSRPVAATPFPGFPSSVLQASPFAVRSAAAAAEIASRGVSLPGGLQLLPLRVPVSAMSAGLQQLSGGGSSPLQRIGASSGSTLRPPTAEVVEEADCEGGAGCEQPTETRIRSADLAPETPTLAALRTNKPAKPCAAAAEAGEDGLQACSSNVSRSSLAGLLTPTAAAAAAAGAGATQEGARMEREASFADQLRAPQQQPSVAAASRHSSGRQTAAAGTGQASTHDVATDAPASSGRCNHSPAVTVSPTASCSWQQEVDAAAGKQDVKHAAPKGSSGSSRGGSRGPRAATKGWTAFTTFGLHTRDSVRQANPGATSVEIEKLVGQAWGRLSPEEKQQWVQRTGRVRHPRATAAASASASTSSQGKRKRATTPSSPRDSGVRQSSPAAGSEELTAGGPVPRRQKRSGRVRRASTRPFEQADGWPSEDEGKNSSGMLDAMLPPKKRSAHAPSPQPSPGFSFGRSDGGDKQSWGALAPAGQQPLSGAFTGGSTFSAAANSPRLHDGPVRTPTLPKPLSAKSAATLELEVGILEVLASMQAAAQKSHKVP